jgi:hypothetical protein
MTLSSQSQSHVTTDDLSANLSWNKAPIWGLRPDFYYCQTIAGLLGLGFWLYSLGSDHGTENTFIAQQWTSSIVAYSLECVNWVVT